MTGMKHYVGCFVVGCGVALSSGCFASTFNLADAPDFEPRASTSASTSAQDDPDLIRLSDGGRGPITFRPAEGRLPAVNLDSNVFEGATGWTANDLSTPLAVKLTQTPEPLLNEVSRNLNAEWALTAPGEDTGLGVDLTIAPRASVLETSTYRATKAGAEIRLGSDLDLRGQDVENSSWYFFAGADGEAIVWDMAAHGTNFTSGGVTLQDKVTVGDIQAGVAFNYGPGQLSLSYLQREFNYDNGVINQSANGDFAAITMTIRH